MYPADGRKIPDHYTFPADLHDELEARFGTFPLFSFWGPTADISSSAWIARATLYVMKTRNPTLTLTYLPHLDYNLQRLGPDLSNPVLINDLQEIDALCGELIEAADVGDDADIGKVVRLDHGRCFTAMYTVHRLIEDGC